MNAEGRRQTLALLLSLLIHMLLLSLTFGGAKAGLPGFGLPWQTRRIEVPELRVVLVPARVAAEQTSRLAGDTQPVADGPQPMRPASPAPGPAPNPAPNPARMAAVTVPEANPKTDGGGLATPAAAALRAAAPADMPPAPIAVPDLIVTARPDQAQWNVPALPAVPVMPAVPALPAMRAMPAVPAIPTLAAALAPASSASGPLTAKPASAAPAPLKEEAQAQSAELTPLDTAKQEARQEARQQAARQQADALERLAAARQEAARAELARLETERQEASRLASARQEAARQEAARQDAARQDAALQEAVRGKAARADAARLEAEQREARLRAIGRQLDEEAARREAASADARLAPSPMASALPSASSARRGRLFGRSDANAELILYAEAWSRKIQLNMTFDLVRDAAKQPHTDPLVTVAIRSDGSVESVSFVRASGVAAIDDAIRRIVQSQANYPPFPPGLAREFDVIEIRRTWQFDMAIRLH